MREKDIVIDPIKIHTILRVSHRNQFGYSQVKSSQKHYLQFVIKLTPFAVCHNNEM